MKCKECNTVDCPFRTTDAEKECQFQSSVIQVPDEWQGVRIQAAIAAMQGLICDEEYSRSEEELAIKAGKLHLVYRNTAINAVLYADALIEELKKK